MFVRSDKLIRLIPINISEQFHPSLDKIPRILEVRSWMLSIKVFLTLSLNNFNQRVEAIEHAGYAEEGTGLEK